MKRDLLACAPLVAAVAAGAWLAFPLYDDGYYLLLTREGGPGAFLTAHADRPLYGRLLGWMAATAGESALALSAVNCLAWTALALITGACWRRALPEAASWSPVAAALVLSPVIVEAQLSTVTLTLPCVLPALLVWGAFEGLDRSRREAAAALAALFAAPILSEYALAAAVAAAPLASPPRSQSRRIAAAVAFSLGLAIFFVTRQTEGVREDVTLHYACQTLGAQFLEAPFLFLAGCWKAAGGGLLGALAELPPDPERPRAALAALTLGGFCAAAWRRLAGVAESGRIPASTLLRAALGVSLGLLPVTLFGKNPAAEGFGSRFLIPLLPAAAILSAGLFVRIVGARRRRWATALLALSLGKAAGWAAIDAASHGRRMRALGAELRPLVESSSGLVAARVVFRQPPPWAPGSPYMLTAQAERDYPPAQRGRLYLWLDGAPGAPPPAASPAPDWQWEARGLTRRGPVKVRLEILDQPGGAFQVIVLGTDENP